MQLNVYDSKKMLKKYKIPLPKYSKVSSLSEISKNMKTMNKPVAMKIISDDIIHKSDIGAVQLNINNLEEAKEAYKKIMSNSKKHHPDAKLQGVAMQEMIDGTQLFIGGKRDPQFGPVVLFGLGGIFVEVLKDISIRICPITKKDAKEMIKEIKGYKIIQGYRGQKVDEQKLIDIILKVSDLLIKQPEIKELDINPIISNESGIFAVDARIIK